MKAPMAGGGNYFLSSLWAVVIFLVLLTNNCMGLQTLAVAVADATLREQPVTMMPP